MKGIRFLILAAIMLAGLKATRFLFRKRRGSPSVAGDVFFVREVNGPSMTATSDTWPYETW